MAEGGRVRLGRRHLSPDGERFFWGSRVFLLDRDEVLWRMIPLKALRPPARKDS